MWYKYKVKKTPTSLNISVQMPLEMWGIWVTFQSSSRLFMLNLWQPNSLYLSSAAKLCIHVSKFVLFAVWNLLFESESTTSLIVSLRISSGHPSTEHLASCSDSAVILYCNVYCSMQELSNLLAERLVLANWDGISYKLLLKLQSTLSLRLNFKLYLPKNIALYSFKPRCLGWKEPRPKNETRRTEYQKLSMRILAAKLPF